MEEEGARGLTTALIGLLGVVLGAAISSGFTYLVQKASDKRRFRHEHESRLREERREAYTAFMVACDRLHGGHRSVEALAEFRRTTAVVWLVSSSTTVRDSVHKLGNFLLQRDSQEEEANSREIDAAYGALLREFLAVAQRDLAIVPAEPGSRTSDDRPGDNFIAP